MAADLHIHVMTPGVRETDLAVFFRNLIGSKWFKMDGWRKWDRRRFWKRDRRSQKVRDRVLSTPSVFVGEVSWLKASLFQDFDSYVPEPVVAVHDIIGENLPVITDDLIAKIGEALKLENKSIYTLPSGEEVLKFLRLHRGKRAFTISW